MEITFSRRLPSGGYVVKRGNTRPGEDWKDLVVRLYNEDLPPGEPPRSILGICGYRGEASVKMGLKAPPGPAAPPPEGPLIASMGHELPLPPGDWVESHLTVKFVSTKV